jgi:hypothetical protein
MPIIIGAKTIFFNKFRFYDPCIRNNERKVPIKIASISELFSPSKLQRGGGRTPNIERIVPNYKFI